MTDMLRKFHMNKLASLRECNNQLCQIMRTGQAMLIERNAFHKEPKSYQSLFLKVASLYYDEASMRILW